MDSLLEFLDEIYISLKYSLRDITVLPGDNLLEALYMALGITLISVLCQLLGIPALLSWQGGLFGSSILGILVLFGRRSNRALFGSNGDSDVRSGVDSGGEESTSIEKESNGITFNDGPSDEDLGV